MHKQAIWMQNGGGADPAIARGLAVAGCDVVRTHGITDTMSQLRDAALTENLSASKSDTPIVLVAEVQAGAIPLLILLREQGMPIPPTLVFDREGTDIRAAIRALQLGAREYLLASESAANRELVACLLAERDYAAPATHIKARIAANTPRSDKGKELHTELAWEAATHVMRIGTHEVRLSPIEARIFELLLRNRGQVVSLEDFIVLALRKPGIEPLNAARQLRPHVMRLRRKMVRYSGTANRIVNTRGAGYMLV